ncbi:MAG: sugar transferase [Lachnospiraceae bacterium]|nr:sugar transferase [Lachnospiraceae bacterium]
MRRKERYKRLLSITLATVIIVMETLIYAYTWFTNYDGMLPKNFFYKGHIVLIALYALLIVFFSNVYSAYKVGYLRIMDVMYSQFLSIICVNFVTWIQLCLLGYRIMPYVPILKMTIMDGAAIILWTLFAHWFYNKIYSARQLLLIYGDRSPKHLIHKLVSRSDKYAIHSSVHVREGEERIKELITQHEAVIVCDIDSEIRNTIVKYCFGKSIRCYIMPKLSDIIIMGSDSIHLFDTPLQLSRNFGLTPEERFAKRILDILVSLVILIVCSPLMLIFATLIKLYDGGPVFYKQERLTQDGNIFMIYKFRSMRVDSEKEGARLAMKNDKRVTPIGNVLRKLHLDELPQILNILKGDMSIVGPRPERKEIADKYAKEIPEFPFRLKVKAGLTGYAQVYGKYNTTPYDKLKLDLYYIQNYSFFLDIKLILLTVKILFQKENTEGVESWQTTASKTEVTKDTDKTSV